jgi:2-polyprenyl-3-methyl-5-hydroxy-6-metoxy-1,4-benzoquinol methylase
LILYFYLFSGTAIDISDVGLNKAKNLAEKKSVSHLLTTITADVTEFDFEITKYDVIVSIFCMFPKDIRKDIHSKCIKALKPNGMIIIECFSPRQNEIRLKSSNSNSKKKFNLGPSLDCMLILFIYLICCNYIH